MKTYIIEDWWKHNGCYDRERVSNIPYCGDTGNYLAITDDWWNGLTDSQKQNAYEEFFEEV